MDASRRKRTGALAQDAWRPQRFHAAAARYQGAVIHAAAVAWCCVWRWPVLEKSERQTVLRRLADAIAGEFASDPQLDRNRVSFDLALREHRRDLVEVIKHLIDLRVLTRVDGDEQYFLASPDQDVLYKSTARHWRRC